MTKQELFALKGELVTRLEVIKQQLDGVNRQLSIALAQEEVATPVKVGTPGVEIPGGPDGSGN